MAWMFVVKSEDVVFVGALSTAGWLFLRIELLATNIIPAVTSVKIISLRKNNWFLLEECFDILVGLLIEVEFGVIWICVHGFIIAHYFGSERARRM